MQFRVLVYLSLIIFVVDMQLVITVITLQFP